MIVIHDRRLPGEYSSALKKKLPGARVVPFSAPGGKVYDSISSHPDIWFFQLDQKTLVHAPGVPDEFLETLKESGTRSVRGGEDPSGGYPCTARYNAARVGNVLFHALEHTDPRVLEETEKRALKAVDVSQGYTRCSVVPVGEKALVTSDENIAVRAGEAGLEALLVRPGHVELPGEKYGFIGGASGVTPEGVVVFLGDLRKHPDHPSIRGFFSRHNVEYVYLEELPVYDAGGLFFIV